MAEPTLVVHGVNTHDQAEFESTVAQLGRALNDEYTFIPVFWGDLGGVSTDVQDTLPKIESNSVRSEASTPDSIWLEAIWSGNGVEDTRGSDPRGDLIAGGIREAIGGEDVRGNDAAQSAEAGAREALPETRYLKYCRDPEILAAVGRAIGEAVSGSGSGAGGAGAPGFDVRSPFGAAGDSPFGTGIDTRNIIDDAKAKAKALMHRLDVLVGAVVGKTFGGANEAIRTGIAIPFVNFFGDIFAYQHHQAEIQSRLWQAIQEHAPGYGVESKPINVMAHSLGGVVTFDAAVSANPPLWIKSLNTFGSQSSFFHVLDPRHGILKYVHNSRVKLPPTIGTWTNLWEPIDFLAFSAAQIFTLASDASPTDVPVTHSNAYGLNTHGSYWASPELIKAVRDTISA